LIGSAFREWSRLRKERYANIFNKVEAINAAAKCLSLYLESKDARSATSSRLRAVVIDELVDILDDVNDIFEMLTGTTCRTCIKALEEINTTVYVYALARDRISNKTNSVSDKERYNGKADPLEENEDFNLVFKSKMDHYIVNNLSLRRGYRNSSFKNYPPASQPSGGLFPELFGWGWVLPYRSAMVLPIQQRGASALLPEVIGCIGFLTVDSAFRGVFRSRFDGPLGASLAETLLLPLYRYVSMIKTADSEVLPNV